MKIVLDTFARAMVRGIQIIRSREDNPTMVHHTNTRQKDYADAYVAFKRIRRRERLAHAFWFGLAAGFIALLTFCHTGLPHG